MTLRVDAPGGVETEVRAVAPALVRLGDEVTIYASDLYDEGRWDRRPTWPPTLDGVPVKRFGVAKRLIPGLTLPLMTGLMRTLAEDDPDVILAHSHRYGHVLESGAVSNSRGIPLAITTHYHPADPGEPWYKAMLLRAQDHVFGMTVYRVADSIVIQTERERAQLSEFAPSYKLDKIPPGIHVAAWDHPEADRPPPGLPSDYLLFAGRIARNKGVDRLFEAYAKIPSAGRPALVLIGADSGMKASLVERAERLGIGSQIMWIPHLEDERQYRAIYRGARAFVLPSEYEAFGMVLLDAMAAGIPIVATAVGGVPEVLEQGKVGRLVPWGDPQALADAIQQTLNDPTGGAAYLAEGRRRVRDFDWGEIARGYRAVFRRISS